MQPINCGFRSLKGKGRIVNPVNKLILSLTKTESSTDLFRTSKKVHELGEQHETGLLLASHYSYSNVFI